MNNRIKSQLLLAFFISILSISADASPYDFSAFEKKFIALLHAEKTNEKYKTSLKGRNLYSTDGVKFDLKKEIAATKNHIISIINSKEGSKFICEYPALFNIFSKKYPEIDNTDYEECFFHRELTELKKIRISFASGYLGNPASFFGHLYITPIHSNKSIENYTYNIGAITPSGEHPLLYVIRGLIGSYDTSYKKIPYLVQTNKYLRQEGRDIYEFDLKITDAENEILFLHLIEMERENTSYYFANKNCAYELAQILNVVSSLNEVNEKSFYYPMHLLLSLQEKGKVDNVTVRSSNKTDFYEFYKRLNKNEKILFQTELMNVLDGNKTKSLFSQEILNFGYAFVKDKEKLNNIKINRINNDAKATPSVKEITLFSRPPIKFNIGLGVIGQDSTLTLKLKPAYYDFVDYPSNVYPGNKITFLESIITFDRKGLALKEIVFIDIHKGELMQSGLEYDNEYEWGVSANYKKINQENFFSLSGYLGKSHFITKELSIQYGPAVSVQSNYDGYGLVHFKPTIRLLGEVFDDVRYSIEYNKSYSVKNIKKNSEEIYFSINLPSDDNLSFDMELSKVYSEKAFNIGLSYYF